MSKKKATYSRKTDTHAKHKHLFGTGNDSDFIINMSKEGTYKLCGVYCMIAMILVALSSVPYYISKAVGTTGDYMMLRTESNETLAFLIMTLLIAAGFIGMLVFMIACVKKEVLPKKNKALWLFAGILVFAVVSTLAANDLGSALFGYLDRAEGLITIIGYIGFFAIGMSVTCEKYRRYAANTLVGIGTANAVMGILQSIPALAKWIPSYYNFLFINYKSEVDAAEYFNAYGAYDASYASDGFCCSPFALGALLTVACAFAISSSAYSKKNAEKIINLVCVGIMSAAAILTQTFPAMLGIACVLVISLVISIVSAAKKTAGKGAVISSVTALAAAAAIFAGVFLTDNFRMRNEHIMFHDSFERLGISYAGHTPHEDGIYPTLWYEGWVTAQDHLLLGVGPDNWDTMYASGEGMEIDRTYNEYLDIILLRGIISGALQAAMLIVTLVKAFKLLKACAGTEYEKTAVGAFTAFAAYSAQAFFNISAASSTPFFYLTIGLIWSYTAKGKIIVKEDK